VQVGIIAKLWKQSTSGRFHESTEKVEQPRSIISPSSVQFHLQSLSVLVSECHQWSTVLITVCLRSDTVYVPNECGIDGKSVASPLVNGFLTPIH